MSGSAGPTASRLAVTVGLAVTLLALLPQIQLWIMRPGSDWSGSYASLSIDEKAYVAYVNALIEGRARRNDSYTGRDDQPNTPQPESIYSIQFIPAYAVSIPSRLFGINASTAFIWLIAISAFISSLALFWLLFSVTKDERIAACGSLIVLCLGTLVALQGAGRILLGARDPFMHLLFLRRYVPAVPFPLFLIFCALVWHALANKNKRIAFISAIAAGATFALLVFSYFFFWTAAAAWLICLALLWTIIRPDDWRGGLLRLCLTGAVSLISLLFYFVLLQNRLPDTDNMAALVRSRMPDIFSPPLFLSALVLIALAYAWRRGLLNLKERAVLFTASFALMPFVVLNQQIITGLSLQPQHYERYVTNYVALIAFVLTAALIRRERATSSGNRLSLIPTRLLLLVALLAFGWGLVETGVMMKRGATHFLRQDEMMRVAQRVTELARAEASAGGAPHPVVLSTDIVLADVLPSAGPQAVLWAPHMRTFSGATLEENSERYYRQLYYTGADERWFEALAGGTYYFPNVIRWERSRFGPAVARAPVSPEEIRREQSAYLGFAASFDRAKAAEPLLSYVIAPAKTQPDFTNLDRWYERGPAEQIGDYTLYRVKLRP